MGPLITERLHVIVRIVHERLNMISKIQEPI